MELRVANTLLYNFMWCSFAFQTHAQLIQTQLWCSLFMMGLHYTLIHPNKDNVIKTFASVNMTAEVRRPNSVTCCVFVVVEADVKVALVTECNVN